MDVKLTGLKLVDAWYHKGPTNLRVKEIDPPKFERYYGEQIIVNLIIKKYLKEDFHFSAYTTYSYIKKGVKLATAEDRIIFYGARVLHLPKSEADLWNPTPPTTMASNPTPPKTVASNPTPLTTMASHDDCEFVSETYVAPKKKSKKEKHNRSKSLNDTTNSSMEDISPASRKRRKRLTSDIASISSTNSEVSSIPKSAKKSRSRIRIVEMSDTDGDEDEKKDNNADSDDVILLSQKNVVIEIDDWGRWSG